MLCLERCCVNKVILDFISTYEVRAWFCLPCLFLLSVKCEFRPRKTWYLIRTLKWWITLNRVALDLNVSWSTFCSLSECNLAYNYIFRLSLWTRRGRFWAKIYSICKLEKVFFFFVRQWYWQKEKRIATEQNTKHTKLPVFETKDASSDFYKTQLCLPDNLFYVLDSCITYEVQYIFEW